ncbi:hypothetical protein DNTS_011048 [Danionella cerebrum]|uniref:Zinc transporter ZIP13 n=1 Tax=Danionella cerebrum TaxID=2873325 RepID=A0A553MTX8_9TELE|nr:hypothetical protein DNTS_011048 [Danionella translucida]
MFLAASMFLPSALRRSGLMSATPEKPMWAFVVLLVGAALLASSFGGKMMIQTAVAQAKTAHSGPGPWAIKDLVDFQWLNEIFSSDDLDVWFCSIMASIVVGLSGIFPLLLIPIEAGTSLKTEAGSQKLKRLLSFAIGGLLGDVFLHLLPEAWAYTSSPGGSRRHYCTQGLWVMGGLLCFLILEKMFPDEGSESKTVCQKTLTSPAERSGELSVSQQTNGICSSNNLKPKSEIIPCREPEKIKTSGYLNLLANCIDNFTHGLAVAGSFLVSRKRGPGGEAYGSQQALVSKEKRQHPDPFLTLAAPVRKKMLNCPCIAAQWLVHVDAKEGPRHFCSDQNHSAQSETWFDYTYFLSLLFTVGCLTTFAILLHEIPHEVGDFAILLRAGFDRWKAARMQLSTALGGVLGACFALCSKSEHGTENSTAWILPFTSGGFLYIALVSVVPDLLEESNPRNSLLHLLLLLCGIAVMAALSVVVD